MIVRCTYWYKRNESVACKNPDIIFFRPEWIAIPLSGTWIRTSRCWTSHHKISCANHRHFKRLAHGRRYCVWGQDLKIQESSESKSVKCWLKFNSNHHWVHFRWSKLPIFDLLICENIRHSLYHRDHRRRCWQNSNDESAVEVVACNGRQNNMQIFD